jgi:hypothetical protein
MLITLPLFEKEYKNMTSKGGMCHGRSWEKTSVSMAIPVLGDDCHLVLSLQATK